MISRIEFGILPTGNSNQDALPCAKQLALIKKMTGRRPLGPPAQSDTLIASHQARTV
jgi:hypothetical protein